MRAPHFPHGTAALELLNLHLHPPLHSLGRVRWGSCRKRWGKRETEREREGRALDSGPVQQWLAPNAGHLHYAHPQVICAAYFCMSHALHTSASHLCCALLHVSFAAHLHRSHALHTSARHMHCTPPQVICVVHFCRSHGLRTSAGHVDNSSLCASSPLSGKSTAVKGHVHSYPPSSSLR